MGCLIALNDTANSSNCIAQNNRMISEQQAGGGGLTSAKIPARLEACKKTKHYVKYTVLSKC
jgi:hypothetical protein